jgi:hypothetical protein
MKAWSQVFEEANMKNGSTAPVFVFVLPWIA